MEKIDDDSNFPQCEKQNLRIPVTDPQMQSPKTGKSPPETPRNWFFKLFVIPVTYFFRLVSTDVSLTFGHLR